MIKQIKNIFYFPVASYFRFLAGIRLALWKPQVIVVTGTSGKTTLLHLIESQLQNKAKYSHFANSSFGIPFDILSLRRKKLTLDEWFYLFIQAPLNLFKKFPKEKLYVVEADCDRPKEGKFLASLLKPDVTLWTGVGKSHSMNFDKLLTLQNRHSGDSAKPETPESPSFKAIRDSGQARMTTTKFSSVEEVIAYEFGFFLEQTMSLAIVNGDNQLINAQLKRTKANIQTVNKSELNDYKVFKDCTQFKIDGKNYKINALLPKETFYSIAMVNILLSFLNGQLITHRHSDLARISKRRILESQAAPDPQNDDVRSDLKIKLDYSFSKFKLPPGRASIFKGIKNTTIIDSSYNATPSAVMAILNMFDLYPANKKWLVMGDMIELGKEEQEEHERLAGIINLMKLDKIILVGPRLIKYTYPKMETPRRWQAESHDSFEVDNNGAMEQWSNGTIQTFLTPKDALDYLLTHLRGGEVVLFKGARFLEGVIEHLLLNKKDASKLCRRELVWQERRKKWGL